VRTLARAKGRRGDGEQFARLSQSLLESEAVRTLPAAAFKLLAILTLGARPPGIDGRDKGSNGVQAVTDSYARRFGFNSRDTVYRSLKTLTERGLIIKTRVGWRSKAHFALYAVAWLPITHRDGQPLDVPERPTDSAWAQTTAKAKKRTPRPSRPIAGHDAATSMEILPSDNRTATHPTVGHDEPIYRPMLSRDEPICRPMVGNTLRVLGTGTDVESQHMDGADAPVSVSNPAGQSRSAVRKKKAPHPQSTNAN
jgi:hypothetical protein